MEEVKYPLMIDNTSWDVSRYGEYGIDWVVEEGTFIQLLPTEDVFKRTETRKQIETLKDNLLNTDYQAIKFSDGALTEEEYKPIRAQRQAWRDEINELEKLL